VRRAELAAASNELVSAVDAKKNALLLDEARQQLAQLEHDVVSHREASRASTNVLREKRNKAQLSVQVAQRNIDSLVLRAPFDGFVVVRENTNVFGGPIIWGMAIPEFRAGDSLFSGATLADVVDTSRVEVSAKIAEGDRANVSAGQPADVTVEAMPGTTLRASVRTISGVAARQPFGGDAIRQFDVLFDISETKARIRPGLSAQLAIAGATLENALYVPRQAVFESGGHPVVYVRTGGGFEAHEVAVKARTETLVVVDHVDAGTEIALVDPRAPSGTRKAPAPAASQRAAR
jgi:HlyD family secretion protein